MILLFEQELPHYRAPVFSALREKLGEELMVCHSRPLPSAHFIHVDQDEVAFPHRELKTWRLGDDVVYLQNVIPIIRRYKPSSVIVRGSIRNLSLLPLMTFFRRRRIPIVAWGQGYSRRRPFEPTGNLVDALHLRIARIADAYVCYTRQIQSTLGRYVPLEKLFVGTNTIDTRPLLRRRRALEAEGKPQVRKRLKLERERYLVYIGRLQPRKQVPRLLRVLEILQRERRGSIGLLLIGSGDDRDLRHQVADRRLEDVHFLGPKSLEGAADHLFAGDILVIPGCLGLAVNHAFLFGLPVISQASPDGSIAHGPEAAYVEQGITGRFSEPDNDRAMAEDVEIVLRDLARYSASASSYATTHLTIEGMMQGFADAVAYARSRTVNGTSRE